MADFLALLSDDRKEALAIAADKSGRPVHLLEKDIWVVWSLRELFASKHGGHLVFKGGTSLSKGYGVIRRFSEDVDLTYDIRAIAEDLIGKADPTKPPSKSQAKKWTDEIRERLPKLVSGTFAPLLEASLKAQNLRAGVVAEGDQISLEYEPTVSGYGYVPAKVTLEFGARSTGEPNEERNVVCDAANHLAELTFPTAKPRVMLAERTFLEKATAIHVYCRGGKLRGERISRHWYDLTRLDEAGYADRAIADKRLAKDVADHKTMFFAEKDQAGNAIDYYEAVNGKLLLVPTAEAFESLSKDYKGMVDDRLLLDEAPPLDQLLHRCKQIQEKANRSMGPKT
jgi:hypothetical protein